MSLELYLAFVAASVALALMPGPNVAIIVSNAISYGPRYGLLTVAGTSSAMVPQLAVATMGLSAVLTFMADWFDVLRWIGVAYLVFLGVQAWRAPLRDLTAVTPPKSRQAIYWRGVLVSLTNPKTLLFFGAFLPQFVDPRGDAMTQLALLSATFFVIALSIDTCWALFAGRSRHLFARLGAWTNRVTGGVLIGAGIGLALSRKP
jgi:threonine/homoserine/homoserine lactone efflux protein